MLKALYTLITNCRIYLDQDNDLVIQIKGSKFKFTEESLWITTEKTIHFNCDSRTSQNDLAQRKEEILQYNFLEGITDYELDEEFQLCTVQ